MPLTWTTSWELGLPEIDDGHKRLVAVIGELQGSILAREQGTAVPRALAALRDCAATVFADERRRVAECRHCDPGPVLAHLDSFSDRIATVGQSVDAGEQVAWELHWFLRDWVRQHLKLLEGRCRADKCLAEQSATG